jgi:hypothetical protein
MMKLKNILYAMLILALFSGCEPHDSEAVHDPPDSVMPGDHSSYASTAGSRSQPYENFEAILQGPAQCGPASFYMILNHFKDHRLFTLENCGEIVDLTEKPDIITANTQIALYINNGTFLGTPGTQLKDAADGLHLNCEPYYVSELNNHPAAGNETEAKAEREKRFAYLFENYLLNNRPVIIHLKRYFLLSGHYIVLTGYDHITEIVHYVDPSGGQKRTISYEEFIKDKWYVSAENRASWYRARWDGEWMGFYRLEEGELQSFYNPHDDLILSRAGQK